MRRRPAARPDPSDDEVTVLALRAAAGDRAAADAFVARTLPDVWRFCAHLLDPASADDATQATYLRALRSIHRYRREAPARSWLLGVARNTCLDEQRSRARRQRLRERLEATAVDSAVEQHPRDADLEALVAGLDDDRREAFVLTQILGFSYQEAADVVGCPIGTIRSRVARARADVIERAGPVDEAERPA